MRSSIATIATTTIVEPVIDSSLRTSKKFTQVLAVRFVGVSASLVLLFEELRLLTRKLDVGSLRTTTNTSRALESRGKRRHQKCCWRTEEDMSGLRMWRQELE